MIKVGKGLKYALGAYALYFVASSGLGISKSIGYQTKAQQRADINGDGRVDHSEAVDLYQKMGYAPDRILATMDDEATKRFLEPKLTEAIRTLEALPGSTDATVNKILRDELARVIKSVKNAKSNDSAAFYRYDLAKVAADANQDGMLDMPEVAEAFRSGYGDDNVTINLSPYNINSLGELLFKGYLYPPGLFEGSEQQLYAEQGTIKPVDEKSQ
ncbi:MAG: hypothetical protein HY367_00455 [Candidatus Aenigmarchaeota archaeon]|nr:hypothetical protein [Candidatus Aenigmarchaeota archaeon]